MTLNSVRRKSMVSKMMRLVVCLVLLVGIATMSADAANKSRIGTAGAQELLIPVGARGMAIGPSSMIFVGGVEGMYWNPAGLGRLEYGVEGMLSHMSYLADINVVYGAIGVKAGDFGNLGFSLKTIGFGKIPVTTEAFPDGTGEEYSPTFLTIGLTYSKLLTDRISVGITGNLISEQIMSTTATGFAGSIGIQYHNLGITGLNVGVAVKDIGPNMKFAGPDLLRQAESTDGNRGTQFYAVEAAGFEMPSHMEIGIGYTRSFDESNSLNLGALFRNNNFQDDEYSLGGEYNFQNTVFLRGGYLFSPQSDLSDGNQGYIYDFTIGLGFHTELSGVDMAFDYAYRHMKYFDGNNVITLRLGF
jgi:hypothetical protein